MCCVSIDGRTLTLNFLVLIINELHLTLNEQLENLNTFMFGINNE